MDDKFEAKFRHALNDVKINYEALLKEWTALQSDLRRGSLTANKKFRKDRVHVSKDDLSKLATEISQLRQIIPALLSKKVLSANNELLALEEEKSALVDECRQLTAEIETWKARTTAAVQDTQTEKQECMKLRCEIQSLSQQLSQQSDYSFSLGSVCCTLLWRVSKHEDSIQAILAGTKVDEFLQLVPSTLQSFLTAYKEDWPQEGSQETTFVLALCGIITNVAACAYGRDFLMSHSFGTRVLDTFLHVLTDAPPHKSARLKNLLLMCLYNISINQKGIRYLSAKSFLPSLVAWILQDENDPELRANCLRLLQSLLCDEDNFNAVHLVSEQLPASTLEQLSRDPHPDIRDLALELTSDLQLLMQH